MVGPNHSLQVLAEDTAVIQKRGDHPVGKEGLEGRREKSEKLHGGRELNLSCLAWR